MRHWHDSHTQVRRVWCLGIACDFLHDQVSSAASEGAAAVTALLSKSKWASPAAPDGGAAQPTATGDEDTLVE